MAKNLSTTPIGIAVWPRFDKPDTKFAKPGESGVYSTKLRLDADKAAPLVAEIDEKMQAEFAKAKSEAKSPMKAKKVKLADPPYAEDEDGSVLFTFKMQAGGISKKDGKPWTNAPALYDAKGKPVNGLVVGNGSKIKVGYELTTFFTQLVGAGVSLRLKAAQIIELVERGSADASYYGFDAEEGGFEADESQINSAKPKVQSGPFQDETPTEEASEDEGEDTDDETPAAAPNGAASDDF